MNSKQEANQSPKGQFVEPKVFKKGDYITLALPGNILVRKHVNYFKQILGVQFVPVTKAPAPQPSAQSPSLA